MKTKLKRSVESISLGIIKITVVGLLISTMGCGRMNYLDKRIDNTNSQVNILNKKTNILYEEIKAYSASSRKRASDQDLALRQLEHKLTSQHETHVESSDTRSDEHDAALRQLDNRVSLQFEANEKSSIKRSEGHDVAMRQLEDRLTSRMVTQKQAYDQENATLRKNVDGIKEDLAQLKEDVHARDANTKAVLANLEKTSRKDLLRLTEDMRERYATTHRALTGITETSIETAQVSTELRTAMQRLIEAHAFFVRGSEALVEKLETEKGKEKQGEAESVLHILYEQRKAQVRLLNEMQSLFSQAMP